MSETHPRACGKCRHFVPKDRERWGPSGEVVGLCDHPCGLLPTPFLVTKIDLRGWGFPRTGLNPGYFGASSYCQHFALRPWWRARNYAAAIAALSGASK